MNVATPATVRSKVTTAPAPVARPPAPPPGTPPRHPSPEAKRRAAAVLEVLAGSRLPAEAAAALGVSLPRFYLLEQQALTGLVQGCEPKPHGRTRTPERALAQLRQECDRLRREAARQQALVRAAQRTIGLPPPAPTRDKAPAGPTKKRHRRPTVRALKAAARLQSEADRHDDPAGAPRGAPAVGDGAMNPSTSL
jgi:hypothetical protein